MDEETPKEEKRPDPFAGMWKDFLSPDEEETVRQYMPQASDQTIANALVRIATDLKNNDFFANPAIIKSKRKLEELREKYILATLLKYEYPELLELTGIEVMIEGMRNGAALREYKDILKTVADAGSLSKSRIDKLSWWQQIKKKIWG